MDIKRINTIRELKESGYQPKSIKEEIRQNLLKKRHTEFGRLQIPRGVYGKITLRY